MMFFFLPPIPISQNFSPLFSKDTIGIQWRIRFGAICMVTDVQGVN